MISCKTGYFDSDTASSLVFFCSNNYSAPVSPTSIVDGQYIHSQLGNKLSEKFNNHQ